MHSFVGHGLSQSRDQTAAGDYETGAETSLTGLTPFTNYFIRVAAVNGEGDVGIIRESVDSLCRDDADMPMPPYIRKAYNRPNAAFVSLFR